MSHKPFFSVVIPTLNREKYISFAIQSVLNQTFGDFEIIVSDNSSTDNTEATVKKMSDKRIRYVKTAEVLPMYDSWEFALNHAEGEYVTFLGDDDAHSAIYLESFKDVIDKHDADMVCCRMADYFYKDNSLTTVPFSNELLAFESKQAIRDIFTYFGLSARDAPPNLKIPLLINAAYRNSLFAEIKNKLGRVNPRILSNDFYIAIIALGFTEKYYFLDCPLAFHGISPESTTTSISNAPKGKSLKETQPKLATFVKVPMDVFVPYNFLIDALLMAKSELGDALNYLDMDFTGYFVHIHQHLHLLEVEGKDISKEKELFAAALDKQDEHVRAKVQSMIAGKNITLKNKLRMGFNNNKIYRFAKQIHDLIKYEQRLVVEGNKSGFDTITSCGKFIDRGFLKKHQTKKN